MKQLLLLFCLALCFASASATHIKGGYITYTQDSGPNYNPRKFIFTMIMLTDQTSQADDPQISINMGDGSERLVVPRQSIIPIGYGTDREIYKWEYTFAQNGNYTVAWNGINRNAGVLNMTAPSDQYSFYISTTIRVSSNSKPNNSPKFLRNEGITANLGQPLLYNLLVLDPDGDSLSYELRTPLRIDQTSKIVPVPGYSLPGQTFQCKNSAGAAAATFKLSEETGQLVWDAPCRIGEYAFAVAIKKWRYGMLLSETIFDMQILVLDEQNIRLSVPKLPNQKFTPDGNLIAKINQEHEIQVLFKGLPKDHTLFAGELSQLSKLPFTYSSSTTSDGLLVSFKFTPDSTHIRNRPYFICFYGNNDGRLYLPSVSVGIIIRTDEPIFGLIKAENFKQSAESKFIAIPFKQTALTFFAEKIDGYQPSISVESDLFDKALEFAFTTRDTSEGRIGKLLFTPDPGQVSETPQTITFNAVHQPTSAAEPIVMEKKVQVIVSLQIPNATTEELAAATYLIYPNPAQNKFTVQAEKPAVLTLYSLQGKLVLEQKLQPGTTEVVRPNATAGLYFYTLTTKDGQKKTGKLVLQ